MAMKDSLSAACMRNTYIEFYQWKSMLKWASLTRNFNPSQMEYKGWCVDGYRSKLLIPHKKGRPNKIKKYWRCLDIKNGSSFLVLDDCTLHFQDHGCGPTILFLSGLGSNWLSWWSIIYSLKYEFRCIVVDTKGSGLSLDNNMTVSDTIDNFAALFNFLNMEKLSIVSQSHGCIFNMLLKNKFKQRVIASICLSSSHLTFGETLMNPDLTCKSHLDYRIMDEYQIDYSPAFVNEKWFCSKKEFLFDMLKNMNSQIRSLSCRSTSIFSGIIDESLYALFKKSIVVEKVRNEIPTLLIQGCFDLKSEYIINTVNTLRLEKTFIGLINGDHFLYYMHSELISKIIIIFLINIVN